MKRNLLRHYSVQQAQRGSYAIEFAMTLPILIIILSGTIDYGWYFHVQMAVINATREGAHAGSQIRNSDVRSGASVGHIETAHRVADDVWTAADLPGQPPYFMPDVRGLAPDKDMVVTSMLQIMPLVGFIGGTPDYIQYEATWHLDDQSEP